MREEQNRKEKRRKNKSLFDTTKNHKLSKIKNIFKYEKLTPYFK